MTIPAIREARPAASAVVDMSATPTAPGARPALPPGEPSPFARLIRGVGLDMQNGEATVHQAMASARGGDLGPAQLIALQANVYRYSEAVDLVSRMVDHATSALKTVIQGQ